MSEDLEQLKRENDELRMRLAEVSDFARFMCNTWTHINAFVYNQCSGDALMKYPVIQGTKNQFDINKAGAQPFDTSAVPNGLAYLLNGSTAQASIKEPETNNGEADTADGNW